MADDGADNASAGVSVRVPGYVVGERIGSGGFGEIYRARHAVIGREVAIKILHATYSTSREAVSRFIGEARAVNQISHPAIVEVFDFGQLDDGRQYYVMELVRGRTLRDLLHERGAFALAEAAPVLRAIAEAVDAAHVAGIAHRDLKPDNVFVLDGGGVKLIDFGLAKLTRENPELPSVTQSGAVFGTPLYMSPEQCQGKATTLATDAYSFGALAYQVLTGEPPFAGDPLGLALHHINDAPVPPSRRRAGLPARVDRVLLALLEKSPELRPMPLRTAVDALVGNARLPRRRVRRAVVLAGIVATAVACSVALLVSDASSPRPATCAPASKRLAGIWDDHVRATLSSRFSSTLPGVTDELDGFATEWSTRWAAACKRDDRPRLVCLENNLLQLRSAAAFLSRADGRDVADAWVGGLTNPISLRDCDATRTGPAMIPEASSDEVRELMTGILVYDHPTALDASRLAVARGRPILAPSAEQLDRDAKRLEALGSAGANIAWRIRARQLTERPALDDAISRAEKSGDDDALAAALVMAAERELDSAHTAAAETMIGRAETVLARNGGGALRPAIERIRARVDAVRGNLASALARLDRAATLAPSGFANMQRIELLSRADRHDDAIGEARAAVADAARRFGAAHIITIHASEALERAQVRAGDLDGAITTDDALRGLAVRTNAGREAIVRAAWRQAAHAFRRGRSEIALRALAAALHGDASAQLAPDDWIRAVRVALDHGGIEALQAALAKLDGPTPTTSTVWDPRNGRSAIDDLAAYMGFMVGDLATMYRRADAVRPRYPSRLVNNSSWLARIELSPWLLAVADAAASRRASAEARLTSLAGLRVGADPRLLAFARTADGWGLAKLERWPDARSAFEEARALPVWTRDWNLAELDAWLGVARLEVGDPKSALEPLEEALDVLAECCDDFHYVAPMAKMALARALWSTGGDRARARGLAEHARDDFARLGRFREAERAGAMQWLAAHPPTAELLRPAVTVATRPGPYAVRAGDVTGDGRPDLVIARVGDNSVGILPGRGDGSFDPEIDYSTGATPYGLSLGDVTGDGKLDVVTADMGDNTLSVFANRGDGTLSPRVAYRCPGPYGIALADLDADGKLDLIATDHQGYTGHAINVLMNRGDGTFAEPVPYDTVTGPFSLAVGDIDGDGKLDVAAFGDSATSAVSVLLGRGNGTFSPQHLYAVGAVASPPASDLASWIALGDVTGDGKLDIAVTNGPSSIAVLVNRGDGSFAPRATYPTGRDPLALVLADFDSDGKLDIAVDNDGDDTIGIMVNTGDGVFAAQIAYSIERGSNSLTAADFDGNGKPDLAVAYYLNVPGSLGVLLHR